MTAPTRPIVTRFAPSPTGYLHIGGARTALFNWLYARGRDGKFLLRIEDTDQERSTPEARDAILKGLDWLGLDFDGEPISQAERADRHAEVAYQMLAAGNAYKCFATQAEITAFRETARAEGRSTLYQSPWRDSSPDAHPDGPFVIRLKAPREGETNIEDRVQGTVTIRNDHLDDMVLLRSDGSPVYMLAVVVDDHDMGVTHVIRGDDHLNNAARQMLIYNAMGWDVPVWAHIPLIHGPDGKKLSKRHGALGLHEYQALGYPAAAMRNYLARLGWSHGDDEYFTDEQAQLWFDIDGIGRSPARLDLKKLANLSGQHFRNMSADSVLRDYLAYRVETKLPALDEARIAALRDAMPLLQTRLKSHADLTEAARFVLETRPFKMDDKAQAILADSGITILSELTPHLHNATWERDSLEKLLTEAADARGIGFGKIAAPFRAAMSGRTVSPSVVDMMILLGRDETLARLADIQQG